MPTRDYSFLDIAVLDDVRAHFAAGDALAVLSTDLEEVIWANGPGAALFGFSDIEAIIGADAQLPLAARRQVMATPGYPDIGSNRSIAVRLASGMTSRTVSFLASRIALPGGEQAILLRVEDALGKSRSKAETAERAIRGFNDAGHFAALIDAEGQIVAASTGFRELGIAQQTLAALTDAVRDETDRLVKRLVPADSVQLPAGMARLTDDPALSLLVVVDERQLVGEMPAANQPSRPAPSASDEEAAAPSPENRQPAEAGMPRLRAGSTVISINDAMRGDETPVEPSAADRETPEPAPDATRPENDGWYFNAGEVTPTTADGTPDTDDSEAVERETVDSPAELEFVRATVPARFVWRTDTECRFSAMSETFANAVGPAAADVIGQKFGDVAARFGFDQDGEIGGLLEHRDTWSGRSVLWPVEGTDLKIPVDLAALPVYDRNRNFEGFRGFGVARGGDAVADPQRIGLTLGAAGEPPTKPIADDALADVEQTETRDDNDETETAGKAAAHDPFQGETPALSIVPKPGRRESDKVVRLAEHRQPTGERRLTPIEKIAFREIGDRLKKDNGASKDAEPPDVSEASDQQESQESGVDRNKHDRMAETPAQDASSNDNHIAKDAHEQGESSGNITGPDVPTSLLTPPAATPDQGGDEARSADVQPERSPAASFLPSAFAGGRGQRRPVIDTSILDKLPVPVLVHSGDVLHYANREFLDFTAYSSVDELVERGGLDALFGDPYRGEDEDDLADRKLRLRRGDGLELPVEALLQSVPWNGGKALLLALRKVGRTPASSSAGLADEEKSRLEDRISELGTIIDTATDGVVLIANDGAIRSISRPAEALFGVDSAEIAGMPFTTLFAMESQRAARDYLNGLSENGVASLLNDGREVIGREAQGRFIPLFMTIGKLPNLGGYCAVVRDITQWKRAEEELTQSRTRAEHASSQKSDFLARVSHEIRTPLNAIIGFSELMIDEKFGPIGNDRYRDYLRDINRSGGHVLDLVNDLLDISKIEAGEQEMTYVAVSLNDTLAETVAMMQPQANRERVIIRSSFASRLPEVVADLRSVRQIALNLLSNAIRYTQAGGQVIISTSYEASGDIAMRVRDTGIGMSQAEIEQALKPFKQINALKRGRSDGTGLGLPLTKAMVEANRAKFTINSTPGEGTLVEVAFPSTRVLAD